MADEDLGWHDRGTLLHVRLRIMTPREYSEILDAKPRSPACCWRAARLANCNKLIARALELSLHSVKRHPANILGKLNVQTRG
jgi:hypothetical protein